MISLILQLDTLKWILQSYSQMFQDRMMPKDFQFYQFVVRIVQYLTLINVYIAAIAVLFYCCSFNLTQQLFGLLLIIITSLCAQFAFTKICSSILQLLLCAQYFLLAFIIQIFITVKIPLATLVFVILSVLILIEYKQTVADLKTLKTGMVFSIQILLILLRVDGFLQIPWILLAFEVPIALFSTCMFTIFMLMRILSNIKTANYQNTKMKVLVSTYSLAVFFMALDFTLFMVFNWILLDWELQIFSIITLLLNLLCFVLTKTFRKQIAYSFASKLQFELLNRESTNSFTRVYKQHIDKQRQWEVQLCSKCCQREANMVSLDCLHLLLCQQCYISGGERSKRCLVCGVGGECKKINIEQPFRYQNKVMKIKLFGQNHYKLPDY